MAELKNRWCEGTSCHFKRKIARNPLCRLWNLRVLLGFNFANDKAVW